MYGIVLKNQDDCLSYASFTLYWLKTNLIVSIGWLELQEFGADVNNAIFMTIFNAL